MNGKNCDERKMGEKGCSPWNHSMFPGGGYFLHPECPKDMDIASFTDKRAAVDWSWGILRCKRSLKESLKLTATQAHAVDSDYPVMLR